MRLFIINPCFFETVISDNNCSLDRYWGSVNQELSVSGSERKICDENGAWFWPCSVRGKFAGVW